MDIPQKKWIKRITLLFSLLTLGCAIYQSNNFHQSLQQQQVDLKTLADCEIRQAVDDLQQMLTPLKTAATDIAETLSTSSYNEPQLRRLIESQLQKNGNLFGIGVAYEPYAFDGKRRLFSPYLLNRHHHQEWLMVDDTYDYTAKEYTWYGDNIQGNGGWNEPYFGQTSQAQIIEYVAPIRHNGSLAEGLVFVTTQLDEIQKRINAIDLGVNGYSILFSAQGKLISHPVDELVNSSTLISDLSLIKSRPALQEMVKQAMTGQQQEVELPLGESGRTTYVSTTNIPLTDWTLLTVYDKHHQLQRGSENYHSLLWLITTWVIALLALLPLILPYRPAQPIHRYWLMAFILSSLLVVATCAIWVLAYEAMPPLSSQQQGPSNGDCQEAQHQVNTAQVQNTHHQRQGSRIINQADLNRYTHRYTERSLSNNSSVPVYLPTGVFIQSVEFSSANNVLITGYVWQRYQQGIHDDLSQGVVFPEAESVEMEENYRRLEGDEEVVGWYFRTTLRETFDYSHYPLDKQSVWIRMWHADFDRNVVLVPDLNAYDHLSPASLPGVERDFVLPGWSLIRSYFEFRENSYNSNFGIDNYIGKNNFPELYFNVDLQRNFIDPFISSLAPVLVVLLMLFAIVITISKEDPERVSLLGFDASTILGSCSALFFVVLIAHIDMRSNLGAASLIFMEDFYFLTYLSILIVSVNSILFTWGLDIRFIQYRDNLLPKISFWPVISGFMYLFSLITFY